MPHDGIGSPDDPGAWGGGEAHPRRMHSPLQPVNVNFNKPFKDCMRWQWTSWMMSEGIAHGTTSQPTRLDVAKMCQ
jgi:hypothetical protein